MKKKWWQIILSYITDIYIERTGSEYNENLDVILKDGRYQLVAANAVYSFEDKYHNFRVCFERMKWSSMKIKKVLVLGLGLGSIPQMLEKNFHKKFEYHIVEIDEIIIGLANEYILYDLKSPLQIFHTDALVYLQVCREKYDLILMDIFEDSKVPESFETSAVLSSMKRLLNDMGCILFNRLNITEKDLEETKMYYEHIFSKQFVNAYFMELPSNIMLCSRNDIF